MIRAQAQEVRASNDDQMTTADDRFWPLAPAHVLIADGRYRSDTVAKVLLHR